MTNTMTLKVGVLMILKLSLINFYQPIFLDSLSLDKIIPSLGYAKGNIWVISYRANTIKNNCTFEEIQKLYEALLKLEVNS